MACDLTSTLACPTCLGRLDRDRDCFVCASCAKRYPIVDGIVLLFPTPSTRPAVPSGDLYERIAGDYDEAIPAHIAEHYLGRRIALIEREMGRGTRGAVLDVCCGTGRLASALAGRGHVVAGVDAAPAMLREFRRRQPDAILAAGHAQRLPFLDGSFDLALSVAALHHLGRPGLVAAALSEMCRVVRLGGKVLVWDHNPLNPYWPWIMSRVPQDDGTERLVPASEVERGLRDAGCSTILRSCLGFTPDFLPPRLLPVWQNIELLAESTPLLRKFAAHNVFVGRKA